MVDYTLVLELGQSNASPIGDIQGWEDNHPELAFRSPGTSRSQVKQYSTGSYRDDFVLAATFKGGPQVDLLGADISGDWQTANLRGVASDAVRVATFYNPIGTLQTFSGYARSWPGTYSVVATTNVLAPNTSREFATNFMVQPGRTSATVTSVSGATATASAGHSLVVGDIVVFKSGSNLGLATNGPFRVSAVAGDTFDLETWPSAVAVSMTHSSNATCYKVNSTVSPFKITRKRTGSTHTYAPTGLGQAGGARLVVDPPFTPAAVDNEEFSVDLRLQQAPATASDPLVFDPCFGGLVQNNPALAGSRSECTEYFAPSSGRQLIHSPATPLRQGRSVAKLDPNENLPGVNQSGSVGLTVGGGSDEIAYGDASTFFGVGDALVITSDADSTAVGPLPAELTDGDTYYVVFVNSTTLKLSETENGAALTFVNGTANSQLRAMKIRFPETSTSSLWPTRQPAAALLAALTSTQSPLLPNVLAIALNQDFVVGEKIRISYATGTGPTNLTAGDYYVQAVDSTTSAGSELLSLSSISGGAALTFTWDGEVPSVERLDAYTMWYVSDYRDGADNVGTPGLSRSISWSEQSRFAGSVSGLRIRCTSGANVGQWKHGKHISYDTTNDLCKVHFDGSWTATPAADDVFVIEPTPVGSEDRPYKKFCQLLPWAPFEGEARGSRETGLSTVTIGHGNTTTEISPSGLFAPDRTSVRFYTTGTLPNGLTPGKTYYSTKAAASSIFISETYNGPSLLQTADAGSGTHYAETVDNDNGFNPHPPGFNYPNQFSIPRRYMPFDGYVQGSFYGEQTSQQSAGISAGLQLSFDLHNYTGRRSLYVPCTFGGSSIGHKEVHPGGNADTFGWADLNQQISWAPGEDNGCFARLLDVLDGVRLALTEEGSTIKEVVVHFNQGEEDARVEYLSSTYRKNLHQFKAAVRQALYDKKLSPVKPARIKWLHATIKEISSWPYASTVNAAITAEALSDPYSRSLVGTDLEVHADRTVFSGNLTADAVHYHGTQMDLLGQRAFAAFQNLERAGRSEIDICNLALANLGEQARVTSIDPSDGSREADLCAQFFDLARDQMLEKHAWDFALRSVTLTKRSSSPRVDYKCAYDYPDDVLSVLSVVRSDVDYNYKTMGNTGQQPYSVELDANGDRVLLTDEDNALLLYVAKVTDSTKWSSLFVRALSWQLACHLAGPVLKGEEGMKMIQMCEQMADRTFRQATKHDGDHKRDVDTNDHVPIWQRHRSNRGFRY